MSLRDISTSTLRGSLAVFRAIGIMPVLCTQIATELARRAVAERERANPMLAAKRARTSLRLQGYACWTGIGGDA